MKQTWKRTTDGQGVVRYQCGFVKIFDYRNAPTVGQHLCWVIFGPFGRMIRSGSADTLRQAKKDALEANPC